MAGLDLTVIVLYLLVGAGLAAVVCADVLTPPLSSQVFRPWV